MRKTVGFFLALILVLMMAVPSFGAYLPRHRGTPIEDVPMGTSRLNTAVEQYSDLFQKYGDQFGVDPNILAAICMQESSGRNLSYRDDGTSYPAWGIMQIEYSLESEFAAFGQKVDGTSWTLADRLDAEKSIMFAANLFANYVKKYDSDYAKAIQAYNFGGGMVDKLIAAKGDAWLDERINAKSYAVNWTYPRYGDAEYIEHVLRYYHSTIPFADTRVNVVLDSQLLTMDSPYAYLNNNSTMVPVRDVAEALNANVSWDGTARSFTISHADKSSVFYIGKTSALLNGASASLTAAPRLVMEKSMIPLRPLADALDLDIAWDPATRTVYLQS